MKTYDYDYVIFIGRVEPPHNGHMTTLTKALRLGQKVIVLLGTANSPRTPKNPFTTSEREIMMRNSMSADDNNRIEFAGIEDRLYDHPEWLVNTRHAVEFIVNDTRDQLVYQDEPRIAIIGHAKDASSKYISDFPEWTPVDVGSHAVGTNAKPLSSTMVRQLMFNDHIGFIESSVPTAVYTFLNNFLETDEWKLLKEEYDHYVAEEKQYKDVIPYWMNFYTADAVVFQSGHVLMGKRKYSPGKGQWCVIGGHVEPTETPYETAFRELMEETKIKVPMGKLKGSLMFQEPFNHPDRSLRCRITGPHGRTHTTAFCISLDGTTSSGETITKLPKVTASDDLEEVRWVPVSEVNGMRHMIFEDHADIILYCHSRLPKQQGTNW